MNETLLDRLHLHSRQGICMELCLGRGMTWQDINLEAVGPSHKNIRTADSESFSV